MTRPDIRARQEELDALARERGWRRGNYRSWHVGGWTVAVSAGGYPKRNFVASQKGKRREFGSLEDLVAFLTSPANR